MHPQSRIRRHGYHLMSLASIGTLCVVALGLLLAAMPWLPGWNPQSTVWKIGDMGPEQILALDRAGRWLATLSSLAGSLGCLAPLVALRRLGDRLYRSAALGPPVAEGFRWLAHSLPLYALLQFAGWMLGVAASGMAPEGEMRFTFDFGGSYLLVVACLCLYSVAHVLRLAVAAAEDARGIV